MRTQLLTLDHLVQLLDPRIARTTIAPARDRVTSLLLPHRLTNRPCAHAASPSGSATAIHPTLAIRILPSRIGSPLARPIPAV